MNQDSLHDVVNSLNDVDGLVANKCSASCRERGFTLVELLCALTVLAILAKFAASAFGATVNNNRLYAAQNEFVASLAFARSEAARRGVPVILSALAPSANNAFAGGWQVFADLDGDGLRTSSEPVLRQHEAIASRIVVGDGAVTSIGFTPMGFLTAGGNVAVKVCVSDGSLPGYAIAIQPNGMSDVGNVAAGVAPCN